MNFCVYILISALLWNHTSCADLRVGIMGTNNSVAGFHRLFVYDYLGAAVPLAFDTAKTNFSLLKNSTVDLTYSASQCNEKLALEVFINLKQVHNVDVILGPQCSSECVPTGLLASQWNIPMISHSCSNHELSDSFRFNTFLRTTGSSSIGGAVSTTLHHFNWTAVALVQIANTGSYTYAANSIRTACLETNISITAFIEVPRSDYWYNEVLQQVIPKARSE